MTSVMDHSLAVLHCSQCFTPLFKSVIDGFFRVVKRGLLLCSGLRRLPLTPWEANVVNRLQQPTHSYLARSRSAMSLSGDHAGNVHTRGGGWGAVVASTGYCLDFSLLTRKALDANQISVDLRHYAIPAFTTLCQALTAHYKHTHTLVQLYKVIIMMSANNNTTKFSLMSLTHAHTLQVNSAWLSCCSALVGPVHVCELNRRAHLCVHVRRATTPRKCIFNERSSLQ